MACNPAYIIPLVCVTLGILSLLSGLLLAVILASDEDHVMGSKSRKAVMYGYIPALCGAGGIALAIGCCACCTLQVKKGKNWAECKRKQRAHRVIMGSESDPPSQQQPIISGYDPRRTPYDILN